MKLRTRFLLTNRELKLYAYDGNVNANGNLHATLRMIYTPYDGNVNANGNLHATLRMIYTPYDGNVNANENLHATLRLIFRNERFISKV